ncbi:hypothetical protein B296_00038966 [Ensete ventricosum]|uniref:Uncharacterized protein n=1 Tax=Ensete ventricosum TaxID=4639 RepID=A0A426ZG31_ENSVE|nr:hypothetical protein B296_00038966 [Ensete ventricosum]
MDSVVVLHCMIGGPAHINLTRQVGRHPRSEVSLQRRVTMALLRAAENITEYSSPLMGKQSLPAADEEVEAPAAARCPPAAAGEVLLVPPLNFAMVDYGVFRSGFPDAANFGFLRTLSLRSVLCVASPSPPFVALDWRKDRLFDGRKRGLMRLVSLAGAFARSRTRRPTSISFEPMELGSSSSGSTGARYQKSPDRHTLQTGKGEVTLLVLASSSKHPNHHRSVSLQHRTGCLVGCLRKLQRWCLASIFDEYQRFAAAKARVSDQMFMERFDISGLEHSRASFSS